MNDHPKITILRALRAHDEVSGESLSHDLHISRAAIGKHIKALREEGYTIEAAPGRGYRLLDAPDTLSAAEISSLLKHSHEFWHLESLPQVSSTTALLKQWATEGAAHGTVLLAEEQNAGQGRLAREWFSPPKSGVWMSFLLRPPLTPQVAQTITLTAACATVAALAELGLESSIKWPNDILSTDGKKLVGIKSEMCADMDQVLWLVTGIGVNVNIDSFPPSLAHKASSLRLISGQPQRRALVAALILDHMYDFYHILCCDGFAPLRTYWLAHSQTIGQNITISSFNDSFTATARDLDANGYLLVERDGKLQTITGGDIFLEGEQA